MTRKEELLAIFDKLEGEKAVVLPLIDDVVFLEQHLQKLRTLPQIEVNKRTGAQRQTEAAKQYVKFFQQYNQAIKTLTGILRKDAAEEVSPLRAFLESRKQE